MADYYPLLARALDAMPDRSLALRQAVYERARGALIGQLRSLDPPLSDDDIDLERNALESAILRLEQDHAAPAPPPPQPAPLPEPEPFFASPANDVTDLPEPSRPDTPTTGPIPPESALPESGLPESGLPKARSPEASLPEASLPEASLTRAMSSPTMGLGPAASPIPETPEATEASEPPIRIQARKGKAPPFVAPPDSVETALSGEAPEAGAGLSALDGNGARQRPRIDVVAPREGRSRLLRNLLVGGILIVVIGLIAVAAFLLRDRPADLRPIATETQDSAQDGAESKLADRVGGAAAPADRPAQARRPAAPAIAASPGGPDLAIAQRAMLYEENTAAGANAPPNVTQGRVVWRLDTVAGEQGQPLETVVRAKAEFPDAGFSLAMTLRRNLDATLPASHTIELVFTASGSESARGVQDIGLLQGKDEESARGSPVAGLPVRVRENLFLIGLSSLPNDVERNTDILLRKNWLDVTLKFSSGLRGIVAFEKGTAGTQTLQAAFDQWHR